MVVETTKKHFSQATIIPILIWSDKTVIILDHEDQILWPIYIIIGNLDAKTWQSQKRLVTLFLSFILIIHKQSKNANNKDMNLKAKISHMTLKTMLQRIYPSLFFKEMRC